MHMIAFFAAPCNTNMRYKICLERHIDIVNGSETSERITASMNTTMNISEMNLVFGMNKEIKTVRCSQHQTNTGCVINGYYVQEYKSFG